jgi:hypothetical protein
VHLNEKKVFPADRDDDKDAWLLDTGASNYMTGRHEALTSVDTSVRGTVRFGDGSLVDIEGIGSVMLQTKDRHKVLTEVYFIPKLKSNIVSLGQLEEGGCKIVIEEVFFAGMSTSCQELPVPAEDAAGYSGLPGGKGRR